MAKFLNTSATNYFLEELIKTMNQDLIEESYLEVINGENILTEKGKEAGGEQRKGRFGSYFLWNDNLKSI
jgi:hypothetical protein